MGLTWDSSDGFSICPNCPKCRSFRLLQSRGPWESAWLEPDCFQWPDEPPWPGQLPAQPVHGLVEQLLRGCAVVLLFHACLGVSQEV
jgi:hypothetical protein